MKKSTLLFVLLFSLLSCENATEREPNKESNAVPIKKESPKKVNNKSSLNTTHLCKINGNDWGYTKASGIVSRHKKTKKRTVALTFKKQLDKGSESIMLNYDGDSFELESATLILKFPKKGGGSVSGHYSLHPDTRDRNPVSDLSGKVDLSNPTHAAGNAELTKFNIKYEKDLLENPDRDGVVTVAGLKFEGIGYSDINKTFEKLNIKKQ